MASVPISVPIPIALVLWISQLLRLRTLVYAGMTVFFVNYLDINVLNLLWILCRPILVFVLSLVLSVRYCRFFSGIVLFLYCICIFLLPEWRINKLYLVGAGCAQWKIGGGSFDQSCRSKLPPIFLNCIFLYPPIFYFSLFFTRQTTPLTKLFP